MRRLRVLLGILLTLALAAVPLPVRAAALTISGVSVDAHDTYAVISWTTSRAANSWVRFGTSTAYEDDDNGQNDSTTWHTVVVAPMRAGTTYYYEIRSRATDGTLGTYQGTLRTTGGVEPLYISGVSVSPNETSAVVTWQTNRPSNSWVQFGTTAGYGDDDNGQNDSTTSHAVVLSPMQPGTTYYYQIRTRAPDGVLATYEGTLRTREVLPDLQISNVRVQPGLRDATITWQTNLPANSWVQFGRTPSYGDDDNGQNDSTTSHQVSLAPLEPGTLYYYEIRTRDGNGRLATLPGSFRTQALSYRLTPAASQQVAYVGDTVSLSAQVTPTDQVAQIRITRYGWGTHVGTIGGAAGTVAWTPREVAGYTLVFEALDYAGQVLATEHLGVEVRRRETLEISDVAVEAFETYAVVTWRTNLPANSWVQFGRTTNYGDDDNGQNDSTTTHRVVLQPMDPGTTYAYEIRTRSDTGELATRRGTLQTRRPDYQVSAWSGSAAVRRGDTVTLSASVSPAQGVARIRVYRYGWNTEVGVIPGASGSLPWRPEQVAGYTLVFDAQDAQGQVLATRHLNVNVEPAAALTIDDVKVEAFGTYAVVTWATNRPANSWVQVGPTTAYGDDDNGQNDAVLQHRVTVAPLQPGRTYFYQIRTRDANGELATRDGSLRTPGASPVLTAEASSTLVNVGETVTLTAAVTPADQVSRIRVFRLGWGTDVGVMWGAAGTLTWRPEQTGKMTLVFEALDLSNQVLATQNVNVEVTQGGDLLISDVRVEAQHDRATIRWSTNRPANSWVRFGPDTTYADDDNGQEEAVTAHSVTLALMQPGKTYHYQIRSRSADGKLGTYEGTLQTRGAGADDHGDLPEQATSAPAAGSISGQFERETDVDFFVLDAPVTGTYTFRVTGSARLTGTLYNDQMRSVAEGEVSAAPPLQLQVRQTLRAGQRYYLALRSAGAQAAGSDYTVQISYQAEGPTTVPGSSGVTVGGMPTDEVLVFPGQAKSIPLEITAQTPIDIINTVVTKDGVLVSDQTFRRLLSRVNNLTYEIEFADLGDKITPGLYRMEVWVKPATLPAHVIGRYTVRVAPTITRVEAKPMRWSGQVYVAAWLDSRVRLPNGQPPGLTVAVFDGGRFVRRLDLNRVGQTDAYELYIPISLLPSRQATFSFAATGFDARTNSVHANPGQVTTAAVPIAMQSAPGNDVAQLKRWLSERYTQVLTLEHLKVGAPIVLGYEGTYARQWTDYGKEPQPGQEAKIEFAAIRAQWDDALGWTVTLPEAQQLWPDLTYADGRLTNRAPNQRELVEASVYPARTLQVSSTRVGLRDLITQFNLRDYELAQAGVDHTQLRLWVQYPVVMLHGILSDHYAWTTIGSKQVSPATRWGVQIVAGDLGFAYPSVSEEAPVAANMVKWTLAQTQAPKVNIVAHSKGGIVTRVMLANHSALGASIDKIITLDSPHRIWTGMVPAGLELDLEKHPIENFWHEFVIDLAWAEWGEPWRSKFIAEAGTIKGLWDQSRLVRTYDQSKYPVYSGYAGSQITWVLYQSEDERVWEEALATLKQQVSKPLAAATGALLEATTLDAAWGALKFDAGNGCSRKRNVAFAVTAFPYNPKVRALPHIPHTLITEDPVTELIRQDLLAWDQDCRTAPIPRTQVSSYAVSNPSTITRTSTGTAKAEWIWGEDAAAGRAVSP